MTPRGAIVWNPEAKDGQITLEARAIGRAGASPPAVSSFSGVLLKEKDAALGPFEILE